MKCEKRSSGIVEPVCEGDIREYEEARRLQEINYNLQFEDGDGDGVYSRFYHPEDYEDDVEYPDEKAEWHAV